MNKRNRFLWGGVLATLAAWRCFQGVELLPLYSPPSEALFFGSYALIAVALFLLFKGVREASK